MNDQDETERTATLLKSALTAAADVMAVGHAPQPRPVERDRPARRAGGWLYPLAAAASVVAIALGAVIVAHVVSPSRKAAHTTTPAAKQAVAQAADRAPRPEYYLTATYPASGQNVLQFQVRRTIGGAVTATATISGANLGWGGYLTAAAGNHAFYVAEYPCKGTGVPSTTFNRITITGSGRISAMAPVGRPVRGMVTTLAVSPDGSRMAYNALQNKCAGGGRTLTGLGSVSVVDLSTGAVRTWQDTAKQSIVNRLSWASDGRTLVVDENLMARRHADLTVFGLDTASGGGSLQAHSTVLLQQGSNCSLCVSAAVAGPGGGLTAIESKLVGEQTRSLVVSIASGPGHRQIVLYSGTFAGTTIFTDPSGHWVLLWPAGAVPATSSGGPAWSFAAGWISDGRLHPLPGAAQVFPQGIAW